MTVAAHYSSRLEASARPRSLFPRNLGLIRELSITAFKLRDTGSAPGYVWSLVKPLMLLVIASTTSALLTCAISFLVFTKLTPRFAESP
ncbi:MAG: hypothetical protein ACYDCS_03705 [Candidatus Dormibacteria bacterium]